ncbi:SDR family NAD(P)-dependent oxidoreductase [Actinoplanes solisilvae]|uniref:SDR family NAD(P)-dependent oxidoreductase n=1 Tax=Actinoplanes solisilvae TaxID=2486853 RepID=UPI000FDC82B2|nr:SDR family NAD(P)-dependent oxidoreductase [Actinoplanes solisilvae]
MDLGINGRTALIVGGSGTLGRAVAAALLAEGVHVVLAARDRGRLEEAARSLDGAVTLLTVDTTDEATIRAAVEQAGPVDILVNAAAPPAQTLDPARSHEADEVLTAFETKTVGYLRTMNAVLPGMRDRAFGRVVNISGQGANTTVSAAGSVRNQAVITASKVLADAYAGTGVTVNVVNPGTVTADPSPTIAPATAGESTPEQVAALVTFLCSAPAAAISGDSVAVGHRVRGVQ